MDSWANQSLAEINDQLALSIAFTAKTGGLNFHTGQKQAILNPIVAHDVLLDCARLRPLAEASLQARLDL